MTKQYVPVQVRRLVERARHNRVGRPHKTTTHHLQFLARTLVLQDRQKGKAEHFDWRKKKDVADLLADEFGFSKNPNGEDKEKGATTSIRNAKRRAMDALRGRLKWSDKCLVYTRGESWVVIFICGFNPMVAHDYRYTPLADNSAFSLVPPVNWYAVYHWEYMEPTVNPDNPAEIGIRRWTDETVECKPFYLSQPGIRACK